MLDDLLRGELTSLVKDELCQVDKDTILKDYVIEASFIPYFNNVMMRTMI